MRIGGDVDGERPTLIGLAITLAGVLLLAGLVLVVDPLRSAAGDAISGDTEALRSDLRDLGAGGVALVLAIAVIHAIVWYPAEILDAAVGFVYGFWIGLLLVYVGWMANAIVAYWIGQHAARPVLFRLFGRDRFLRYERLVDRGGATMLLAMRLIPIVPFSLFSFVAGSARAPVATFLWTTAVGYLPLTALFVYLGSRLEELSPTDPILWVGAIALLAGLALAHRFAPRRSRDRASEGAAGS